MSKIFNINITYLALLQQVNKFRLYRMVSNKFPASIIKLLQLKRK